MFKVLSISAEVYGKYIVVEYFFYTCIVFTEVFRIVWYYYGFKSISYISMQHFW